MSHKHNTWKENNWRGKLLAIVILASLLFLNVHLMRAIPGGVEFIYNRTENMTPRPGGAISTVGGSFTTMVLNATSQTLKWKAYVGNVTGRFTLDDAGNYTVYDWGVQTIAGEIYVSRNASVDLSILVCANDTIISKEMEYLNHNDSMFDSINRTFNMTTHNGFYAGTTHIGNSSCPSIATYINDTAQDYGEEADFQEVLLQDQDSIVYASILTDAKYGFDYQQYDFQMIVAENEFLTTPTTYYFWAELG